MTWWDDATIRAVAAAFDDGYGYAQEMHAKYGYAPDIIRDSATGYCRDTYVSPEERGGYDDGVSAYLYAAFGETKGWL